MSKTTKSDDMRQEYDFSGYQPLIRAYVGKGLRKDLDGLDGDANSGLIASLRKRGESPALIEEALAEIAYPYTA